MLYDADESVTVTVTGARRDVDLLLLASSTTVACNPYNPDCLATSARTGTEDESLTFSADAGQLYYLAVDSYGYRSASDVFAVGDGGVILHYDGIAWSAMDAGLTSWAELRLAAFAGRWLPGRAHSAGPRRRVGAILATGHSQQTSAD